MLHRVRRLVRTVGLATTVLVVAPLAGPMALADGPSAGHRTTSGSNGVVAQQGDHSPTVTAIQQALVNAGITVRGGVDGWFGPGTAAAVTEYQRHKGLTASGVVDVATGTALGVVPATPLLAKGAHSDVVKLVQAQLMKVGITVRGGADGWFGSGTEAAVKAFQQAKGLPVTGQVDAATAAILANASAAAGSGGGSSGSAGASSDVLIRPGTYSAAVKSFQQQLIVVGLRPKGGADGAYGPATVTSLKLFQQWAGLPATGVYDRATADALTAAAKKAVSNQPSGTGGNGSVQLAAFPVSPTCNFWDTWGAPRSGGRVHVGVDIIVPLGTPVYAVQQGTITKTQPAKRGSNAGNAIWLTTADGTYFWYGHLNAFAAGIGAGTPVQAGQLIGYVGKTGNASIPHLHFEVHPKGGGPVNPYPIVKAASSC